MGAQVTPHSTTTEDVDGRSEPTPLHPGARVAHRRALNLPNSTNTGAWSNLVIPYATVATGMARRLAARRHPRGRARGRDHPPRPARSTLDEAHVTGRLIVLPAAVRARRRTPTPGCGRTARTSTVSSRVRATGTIQERIAHRLSTRPVPDGRRGDGPPQRRPRRCASCRWPTCASCPTGATAEDAGRDARVQHRPPHALLGRHRGRLARSRRRNARESSS